MRRHANGYRTEVLYGDDIEISSYFKQNRQREDAFCTRADASVSCSPIVAVDAP